MCVLVGVEIVDPLVQSVQSISSYVVWGLVGFIYILCGVGAGRVIYMLCGVGLHGRVLV